jgi:hypothetical protein
MALRRALKGNCDSVETGEVRKRSASARSPGRSSRIGRFTMVACGACHPDSLRLRRPTKRPRFRGNSEMLISSVSWTVAARLPCAAPLRTARLTAQRNGLASHHLIARARHRPPDPFTGPSPSHAWRCSDLIFGGKYELDVRPREVVGALERCLPREGAVWSEAIV